MQNLKLNFARLRHKKCIYLRYAEKEESTIPQWGESFSKQTSVVIVIVFWLKWAGYLAVAGLNLLPYYQIG